MTSYDVICSTLEVQESHSATPEKLVFDRDIT